MAKERSEFMKISATVAFFKTLEPHLRIGNGSFAAFKTQIKYSIDEYKKTQLPPETTNKEITFNAKAPFKYDVIDPEKVEDRRKKYTSLKRTMKGSYIREDDWRYELSNLFSGSTTKII